ncbi:hypothetical protein COV19_03190 [Candidatus Woesearchaeota archaeon CG10_big_fil_rev_8_21_14_0_10_44_13]|nr:MAG: hypothetical protein COV19_03190 [Candidatus Woesearchaeota archaeon CG10_big_fil_rev_8_21_14_0_10_44_13]
MGSKLKQVEKYNDYIVMISLNIPSIKDYTYWVPTYRVYATPIRSLKDSDSAISKYFDANFSRDYDGTKTVPIKDMERPAKVLISNGKVDEFFKMGSVKGKLIVKFVDWHNR